MKSSTAPRHTVQCDADKRAIRLQRNGRVKLHSYCVKNVNMLGCDEQDLIREEMRRKDGKCRVCTPTRCHYHYVRTSHLRFFLPTSL